MFDNFVLPELVEYAKYILEHDGEDALVNYNPYFGACGCMGPKKGEYLCPCKQRSALKTNTVEIVSQFDEDLAKLIWLHRFVAALPG